MYLENRWLGTIFTTIDEVNNPKRPGVPAAVRIEFTKGWAYCDINEYHLGYDAPGECRGVKRLAFRTVRVLIVGWWCCSVAVCGAVRHGLMDRWERKAGAPALEENGPGLRVV